MMGVIEVYHEGVRVGHGEVSPQDVTALAEFVEVRGPSPMTSALEAIVLALEDGGTVTVNTDRRW